jgi:hypothetical protein
LDKRTEALFESFGGALLFRHNLSREVGDQLGVGLLVGRPLLPALHFPAVGDIAGLWRGWECIAPSDVPSVRAGYLGVSTTVSAKAGASSRHADLTLICLFLLRCHSLAAWLINESETNSPKAKKYTCSFDRTRSSDRNPTDPPAILRLDNILKTHR